MHTTPTLPRLHFAARFIAATLAAIITVALLTFVIELFQAGPREHAVAASRAPDYGSVVFALQSSESAALAARQT